MPLKDKTIKRVLLKLSGEALMGDDTHGIQTKIINRIASEVKAVRQMGVDVCLVVGGGNIYRGINGEEHGIKRTPADHMGMLATVINAIALKAVFENHGLPTRVMSAIHMREICEPYIHTKAIRHLEKGRVVIFAAGTGNPYFTTDTAATLRASEMDCDVLLKGTKVDGIYSEDPHINPEAVLYSDLTYTEVLSRNLRVMDSAAIALARENNLPVIVFNIRKENGLVDVIQNRGTYTTITNSNELGDE